MSQYEKEVSFKGSVSQRYTYILSYNTGIGKATTYMNIPHIVKWQILQNKDTFWSCVYIVHVKFILSFIYTKYQSNIIQPKYQKIAFKYSKMHHKNKCSAMGTT